MVCFFSMQRVNKEGKPIEERNGNNDRVEPLVTSMFSWAKFCLAYKQIIKYLYKYNYSDYIIISKNI